MRVLVIGGTGFIGRHLVARLVKAGHAVNVPTRRYQNGRDLLVFPPLNLLDADVHDDRALEGLLSEADAVINLAGILHSRPGKPYGPDFARVHVELPRRIAATCRKLGVRRLLHVSALGASANGASGYQRSKAACSATINLTGQRQLSWPVDLIGFDTANRRMRGVGQTNHRSTNQVIYDVPKGQHPRGGSR